MGAASTLEQLWGSIPPLVTPFRGGEVDYETYGRLVEAQVAAGSHGVLVNGTTGEPSLLTVDERNRLVDVAMEAAAGRLPVVAATGSQSLLESRQLTVHAAEAGVAAVLVVTPYYVRPPQRGIVAYYAQVVDGLETPWLVYHIPGRAAVGVTVDTLAQLHDASPTFVGMKHAVNDLGLVSAVLARLGPDFRVFVGLEELSFPMMAVGACGLMNAVGNVAPARLVEICEAVRDGDLHRGRKLHESLYELNEAVFFDTNPIPVKYMMKRMGLLADNEHRLPMVPATPEVAARLDAVLDRAGLLPG
jgi:4-hydroxy-tetrahydrodipicolinate synthase